jgi:hypothetical protein
MKETASIPISHLVEDLVDCTHNLLLLGVNHTAIRLILFQVFVLFEPIQGIGDFQDGRFEFLEIAIAEFSQQFSRDSVHILIHGTRLLAHRIQQERKLRIPR